MRTDQNAYEDACKLCDRINAAIDLADDTDAGAVVVDDGEEGGCGVYVQAKPRPWWSEGRNLRRLVRHCIEVEEFDRDNLLYLLAKPWKFEAEHSEAGRLEAEREAERLHRMFESTSHLAGGRG